MFTYTVLCKYSIAYYFNDIVSVYKTEICELSYRFYLLILKKNISIHLSIIYCFDNLMFLSCISITTSQQDIRVASLLEVFNTEV